MFDLGWVELLLIGGTALVVVGPKDLPILFKKVGKFVGKARRMAREFQSTIEAAADETGLKETSKIINSVKRSANPVNLGKTIINSSEESSGDDLKTIDRDSTEKKDEKDLKKKSFKQVSLESQTTNKKKPKSKVVNEGRSK